MIKDIQVFKEQLGDEIEWKEAGCDVTHEFADGIYSRRMTVEAGTLVVGKVHRFRTYNIFLRGRALMYMGKDEKAKEITAPMAFTSEAGVRKIAYFTEDSEWINVHPTLETDVKKIEDFFIIPEKLLGERGFPCLGQV